MIYTDKEIAQVSIREKIMESNLVCLRDIRVNKFTNKPLNRIEAIAFSEDGLRGSANKMGKYIYSGATNLKDAYRKPKLKYLRVEKYIPSEKPSKEEILWLNKAWRLISMK